MASKLVEMYRHNLWANLRLLDVCAKLNKTQLQASAVGTYGPIADTLVHIVGGEEYYLVLLTGRGMENRLSPGDEFPGIADLRRRARSSGEGLIAVASRIRSTRVLRGTGRRGPYEMPAVVPLVQAINHATEHRSQVMTILTQLGIEPPELDGWGYAREADLLSDREAVRRGAT